MTEIDTAALRADLAVWGVRASSPELAFALCDEVDRLRAVIAPDGSDGHPCVRVEAYMRLVSERDEARAALDRVRALADLHAIAARAVAHSGEERRWLDVLAIIALATPAPADAEDGGR